MSAKIVRFLDGSPKGARVFGDHVTGKEGGEGGDQLHIHIPLKEVLVFSCST